MKIKILLVLLAVFALGRGALATDITVSASQVSNAQFPSAGASRSIIVNATNSSTTVTSAALFPSNLVGVGGWKIIIDGTTYGVASVESTSSLTLSSSFTSSTTSYTATVPAIIFLQLYSDRAYTPLSATYIVQPGNPSQPNGFFARYGCSIIANTLYIPAVTIPSMIDSANALDRTARISAIFFTTTGSRLVPYQNFTSFQVPATPTTTTWTALATYNAPASTYQLDSVTYSRDQVAALLASVAAISGVASNQLVYGASSTTIASSSNATLNSSGNLVAATLASSAGITGQTLALSKTTLVNTDTMVSNTLTVGYVGAGLTYYSQNLNTTTTTGLTGASGLYGSLAAATNANAITVDEAIGAWGRVRNTVASAITTDAKGVFGEVLNSNASATMTNAYGGYFRILNSGTITNSYGVYVGDVTSGTQTNQAYSFYASDTNARNYFAGNTTLVGTVTFTAGTASTVPYLDSSKNLTSSAVTPTELGYVSGVTSAIQTQLNAKAPSVSPSFTTPALGVATATSIAVGGGTAITKILTGSASLDFGATAAGTCDTLTITGVTGAANGDEVFLGIPDALAASDTYQTFYGWVSASGTISVKRCNPINATTALSNPAAATVNVVVFHH